MTESEFLTARFLQQLAELKESLRDRRVNPDGTPNQFVNGMWSAYTIAYLSLKSLTDPTKDAATCTHTAAHFFIGEAFGSMHQCADCGVIL